METKDLRRPVRSLVERMFLKVMETVVSLQSR